MEIQPRENTKGTAGRFNVVKDLYKRAWFPWMTASEAEQALSGKPPLTYLLRKNQTSLRKYEISYVDTNGLVHHDTFTLVNPKLGIFLNAIDSHLGKLAKVVRDMMHCERHQGQPLTQ